MPHEQWFQVSALKCHVKWLNQTEDDMLVAFGIARKWRGEKAGVAGVVAKF